MSTPPTSPSTLELDRSGPPPWLILLIPALVALAAFAQIWGAGFVYDDLELLDRNPAMSDWATIWRAFTEPFWSLAGFQDVYAGYYRPIGGASFVLLHQLGDGSPTAFHAASTLFHAGSAALVAALALALGGSRAVALIAGLAFALSGAHVEAVAWASALPDLLATFFSLIALLSFVRGRLIFCLLALALAALAKEAAYATWLLILGATLLGSTRLPLPPRSWTLLGLTAVAALVYVLRGLAFGDGGFDAAAGLDKQLTFAQLSRSHELSLAVGLIARYVGFLFYPVESRPFRPLRLDQDPSDLALGGVAVIGAALAIAAAAFWFLRGRRSPFVLIGLGLMFGGLAPVLNTNSIGRFPFEERFAYLSSAGWALLIGWLLVALHKRLAAKRPWENATAAVGGLAAFLLAVNLMPIIKVTPRWADNEGFARWSTEVSPETMTPWLLAGLATLERAQSLPQGSAERAEVAEESFQFFQRSLEIDVNEVLVAAHEREAGNVGLGNALYTAGDYQTAQKVFEETLKGWPYAQEAHFGLSNCLLFEADIIYQRGATLQDPVAQRQAIEQVLERADRALVHADQATRGIRTLGAFYHNRSVARYWIARLRDPNAFGPAEDDASKAVAMAPEEYLFVTHLAEIQFLRNRLPEMRETLEAYLRAVPDSPFRAEVEATLAGFPQNG